MRIAAFTFISALTLAKSFVLSGNEMSQKPDEKESENEDNLKAINPFDGKGEAEGSADVNGHGRGYGYYGHGYGHGYGYGHPSYYGYYY